MTNHQSRQTIGGAALSASVVYNCYARMKDDGSGKRENWLEIIARTREMHKKRYPSLAPEIDSIFKRYVEPKILSPSGRSLRYGGAALERNHMMMYNCCFTPITDWKCFHDVFLWLISGTGAGFSVQKEHIAQLPVVKVSEERVPYVIPDSIEGWAAALGKLMHAALEGSAWPEFDYSQIRPRGSPLKTVGGIAPGPHGLWESLTVIAGRLVQARGRKLTTLDVYDIVCFFSKAIMSGGIRRSALICLFSFDDELMFSCKSAAHISGNAHRYFSNNSCVLHDMKPETIAAYFDKMVKYSGYGRSGEPGFFYNPKNADGTINNGGTNPCGEAGLDKNCCCLVEMNVSKIQTQLELNELTKAASFLNTIQAGYQDFPNLDSQWEKRIKEDSLTGIGMTGICAGGSKVLSLDLREASLIARKENGRVAKLIGIAKSARICLIKPSGTMSPVMENIPFGAHAPFAEFFIRRITVLKNTGLAKHFREHYPQLVESKIDGKMADGTKVLSTTEDILSFPIRLTPSEITRDEHPVEMLKRIEKLNLEWIAPSHRSGHVRHNTSATVYVKPEQWPEVEKYITDHPDSFRAIAFLAYDGNQYDQLPHEEVSEQVIAEMEKILEGFNIEDVIDFTYSSTPADNMGCSTESCERPFKKIFTITEVTAN